MKKAVSAMHIAETQITQPLYLLQKEFRRAPNGRTPEFHLQKRSKNRIKKMNNAF